MHRCKTSMYKLFIIVWWKLGLGTDSAGPLVPFPTPPIHTWARAWIPLFEKESRKKAELSCCLEQLRSQLHAGLLSEIPPDSKLNREVLAALGVKCDNSLLLLRQELCGLSLTQHGGNMFLNKILGVHWLSVENEGDKCLPYLFQFYCTEKRFMLEFSGTSSCGFWEKVITHSRAYLMLMKLLDFKEISLCQVVPRLSIVGLYIDLKDSGCSWLQVFELNSTLTWNNSRWKVDYPF